MMSDTEQEADAADAPMEKYKGAKEGAVGASLVVVGLSSARAPKECLIRDDMIRVAHRAGVSIRELSEVSGIGRKTVTAIVSVRSA
jgi:hypothetical protein